MTDEITRWHYTDRRDDRDGYYYFPHEFRVSSKETWEAGRRWMDEQYGLPLERMAWRSCEEEWPGRLIAMADPNMAFAFRMRWC